MGHEAVGDVVALGEDVEGFKVGDMVISPFSLSCGKSSFPSFCTKSPFSPRLDVLSSPPYSLHTLLPPSTCRASSPRSQSQREYRVEKDF